MIYKPPKEGEQILLPSKTIAVKYAKAVIEDEEVLQEEIDYIEEDCEEGNFYARIEGELLIFDWADYNYNTVELKNLSYDL